MSGPIKFVYTIIWFAIGLTMVGQLKTCTMIMAGMAVEAQSSQLSLSKWNQQLVGKRSERPKSKKSKEKW
jgi:hypothetical protein